MPRFGQHNLGPLVQELEDRDRQPALPSIELPKQEARQAGWQLVGAKGFACFKCHSFGRYKATGIQSIDLTIMTRRLKQDWFRRYLRNPQRYRRGTRMPSPWPEEGPSLIRDILDGDSERQIQAVWDYLSDGPRARLPRGLISDSMELIPIGEAILYRNFIAGAGPRGIGVGYPEGLNLAYDAQQLRLALIWQGAFIDARRHWTGRGQGFEPPAGDNIVEFAPGPEWAQLPHAQDPWPGLREGRPPAGRFLGYRVTDDQRPTFYYQIGDVTISDWIHPEERTGTVTFLREFRLKRDAASENAPSVWLRAARAGRIELQGPNTYRIDGRLTIAIELPEKARVIELTSDGETELRIELPVSQHESRLQLEYIW